jgi:hypothetical protein
MFLLKDKESKDGEEAVLGKEGGEELSAAQTTNDRKLGLVVSELVLLKEVSLGGSILTLSHFRVVGLFV